MRVSALARFAKFRQRFGIAAPRVAVYSEAPWYLRWLALGVALGLTAAAGAWLYDARHYGGLQVTEMQDELQQLRQALDQAKGELERVRATANAADSRVSIERSAQSTLAKQIRALESENARLREDLATFENMLAGAPRNGPPLAVHRFNVEPDALPGEYRYRLLLVAPGGRKDLFQGRLELLVNLTEGERNAMMAFPQPGDAGAGAFRLSFKYFQKVEGTFRVSPKAKVESVQVRVYEAGIAAPRASLSAAL